MVGAADGSRVDVKWRGNFEESVALGLFAVGVALLLVGAIGAAMQIFVP